MHKLVTYLSQTGHTARLAECLADAMDADLYELELLLWQWDPLGAYDRIYLGFPLPGGEVPGLIRTILGSGLFRGKRILPFSAAPGCDMEKVRAVLQSSCPEAEILPGAVFPADASLADLAGWAEHTDQLLRHTEAPR